MNKRFLNCVSSDFQTMNKADLLQAIKASEGRTVLVENVCTVYPPTSDVTGAEIARACGGDLVLLNTFDVFNPQIMGLPETNQPVKLLKELAGRPIGVNIEPVDQNAKMEEEKQTIADGRMSSEVTFKKASELGFDFICLTGNPGTGVSNKAILDSIYIAKEHFSGLIIAGKMHGAGVSESVMDLEAISDFIDAGADIILIPAAGTVPGVTMDDMVEATRLIKQKGALSLSANGTSQDTAHPQTIREIALMGKMAGVDIHHIGDSGPGGIAPYQNIFELSRTIRGERHTIRMMASSAKR